jgi:hypothetical protein
VKECRFQASDIGLAGTLEIDGAAAEMCGSEVSVRVPIPARGHRLLKIKAAGRL